MAVMQRSLCSRSKMLSPQAEQKSPVTAGTTMDPSLYGMEISRVSWMRPAAPQHGQFMSVFLSTKAHFVLSSKPSRLRESALLSGWSERQVTLTTAAIMVKARMKCLVDILDRRSALFKIPKVAFDATLSRRGGLGRGLTPNIKALIFFVSTC